MKNNQSIFKILMIFSLLTSAFAVCVVPFAVADGQSASLPLRTMGDEWTFVVDYKGDEGLLCNLTTTVTDTSVTSPSGKSDCFELTSLGTGIVYGTNVSGTWSMTIKEYYDKSDFSLAEMNQNRTVTTIRSNGSAATTQTVNIVYAPSFGINNGFPLSAGKTWSATSNVTITTSVNVAGVESRENSTSPFSMNFVVTRLERISTEAGEFETYVLRGTAVDGSVQEIYYAPQVGMQVKEVDYDAQSNIIATMGLVSYKVAPSSDMLPVYWIVLAVGGAAIAVCAVGFVALRQRKTKKSVQ